MKDVKLVLTIGAAVLVVACKFPALPDISDGADDSDADVATDAPTDVPIDVPTSCAPNTTTCNGELLTVCDAQGSPTNTVCSFGCAGSGTRCNDLAPSNNLATHLDQAATANPLVLTGDATIDTTARTVTNGDGGAILVQNAIVTGGPVEVMALSVRSLSASNVTVRGSRALAILVDGNVVITGHFSATAALDVPGAGALTAAASGTCDGSPGGTAGNNYAGSGGGAHGTNGGSGGAHNGTAGGSGGIAAGNPTNVPLRGGCPGGFLRGPGGAGGGAIQISARGSISVQASAFISAGGGSAQGWGSMTDACFTGSPCEAGGGGGAGGAILLEASSLVVDVTGGIVANGGAGHYGRSASGQNGQLSESPATPYMQPGCPTCPIPGSGAAGGAGPGNGGGSTSFEGAGGGGGGGRIRINLPPGASFDASPPVVSPTPTVGAVAVR